ncbi:type II toxin-antitoxin system PemK/MazF family toxin [uncultured Thiodictyon sp.]|uniref:type II toxin-antitoxin system PemK/MazF family toxin n=1 Tax=uncultured Thiodictyon sp. TaxID=1846217 RepID=UPI0025E56F40|nr:type II toxin-antitoxin system PemK/MazF family toxin [uncultured Thiodictyon sp.]
MTFEPTDEHTDGPGAVVRVPFPFTDRDATKVRPALILSCAAAFGSPAGHSVLAMITSAKHSAWPLDVPIQDLTAAGLPTPSLVRMKLFTLDHALIRGRLGRLGPTDARAVRAALIQLLDLKD